MRRVLIERQWSSRRVVSGVTLLMVIGASVLTADSAPKSKHREAAKASDARTREMFGIRWQASFEAACRAAQGKTLDDAGKPVMHLRVLGDPAGYM